MGLMVDWDYPIQTTRSRTLSSRVRLMALILFAPIYYFTYHRNEPIVINVLDFCPSSNPNSDQKVTPTIILQSSSFVDKNSERTYWIQRNSFLPKSNPLRLAQNLKEIESSKSWSANLEAMRALEIGNEFLDRTKSNGLWDQSKHCPIFSIPISPPVSTPSRFKANSVMFGIATTPDRSQYNLKLWQHWIPKGKSNSQLPTLLIVTPPLDEDNYSPLDEKLTQEKVLKASREMGINLVMRSRTAASYETRYLGLLQELFNEAKARQLEGIITEWFVIADDDTFFPDYDVLIRMLSAYDSPTSQDFFLGAQSESMKQMEIQGDIAYGGAGIYISRSLMFKINSEEMWQECLDKFGSAFGGDAMISQCAALALSTTVPELLTIESTLHQLDIRGDSTGWFQSGFLITSLHHWGSWFTIFPSWSIAEDQRDAVLLLGKVAKLIGADNFGRRIVFEGGSSLVSLGYSISLFTSDEIAFNKTEHTWNQLISTFPVRPKLIENKDKTTYYISNAVLVSTGVIRLEHKNSFGERVDIMFDTRRVEHWDEKFDRIVRKKLPLMKRDTF